MTPTPTDSPAFGGTLSQDDRFEMIWLAPISGEMPATRLGAFPAGSGSHAAPRLAPPGRAPEHTIQDDRQSF
jgi:hypothetical protein